MATTAACFGDSGDKSFGSQVNTFCRPFDFTLYFEDIILEVIPAAVFLFLLPGVFWILLHQKHIVSPSTRLHVKCVRDFVTIINSSSHKDVLIFGERHFYSSSQHYN